MDWADSGSRGSLLTRLHLDGPLLALLLLLAGFARNRWGRSGQASSDKR